MGILRVEDTHFPKNRYIRIQDKLFDLSLPKVMGILNTTPDSFYSASRIASEKALLSTVNQMIEDGVDILDIGGYSTRPDSEVISEKEELKRILDPIISIKKHFPYIPLALDTFRGSVASAGIEHGIDIINDVSGLQYDPSLTEVVSKNKIPYILMHSAKSLKKMHEKNKTENLYKDMIYFFSNKLDQLSQLGVHDVIIDPGFGFGKTIDQNYDLMNNLELFHILERPILVGISRKSMIHKKLLITPEESLNGTTILNTQAIIKGASILRVHDVKEAKQIIHLLR